MYRVYVATMKESHRITYWVTMVNPTGAVITPHYFTVLEHAEETANDYAAFLGVEAEPYTLPEYLKVRKVGDIVNIDCGYGGPDFQDCEILSIKQTTGVFGEPKLLARVKMPNGTEFDADIQGILE